MTIDGATMSLGFCFPFVSLLFCLACLPLWIPAVWGRYWAWISNLHAAAIIIALWGNYGFRDMWSVLLDTLLNSYIAFIAVISSLFIVAAGIRFTHHVNLTGSPASNTLLMFIGAFMASWMGTAGASLLFIRPLINANSWREKKAHTFVFFIFLVCNVGGALTPLGDPPLFMGFINGIKFFWFYQHCSGPTFVLMIMLLIIYFCVDEYFYRREPDRSKEGKGTLVLTAVQKKVIRRVFAQIRGEVIPDKPLVGFHYTDGTHVLPQLSHLLAMGRNDPKEQSNSKLLYRDASANADKEPQAIPMIRITTHDPAGHVVPHDANAPHSEPSSPAAATTNLAAVRSVSRMSTVAKPPSETEIKQAFDVSDDANLGYLTVEQLKVIGEIAEVPFTDADIKMIESMDTNKDGHIDYEEFRAVILAKMSGAAVRPDTTADIITKHRRESSVVARGSVTMQAGGGDGGVGGAGSTGGAGVGAGSAGGASNDVAPKPSPKVSSATAPTTASADSHHLQVPGTAAQAADDVAVVDTVADTSVPRFPRIAAAWQKCDDWMEAQWQKYSWTRFIDGWRNIPVLIAICLTTFLTGLWAEKSHDPLFTLDNMEYLAPDFTRDVLLYFFGILSFLITSDKTRRLNDFHWGPLIEVAIFFFAIFFTMIPPILILEAGPNGALSGLVAVCVSNGEPHNLNFYWLSGIMSGFLDNTPTFLVFFGIAQHGEVPLNGTIISTDDAVSVLQNQLSKTLASIATGSVFFGALSYIGNAPNFFVKNICEAEKIAMPSFFGYMAWSVSILVPCLAIVGAIFFT